MAGTEREEFQELPGEVLVRALLLDSPAVEPDVSIAGSATIEVSKRTLKEPRACSRIVSTCFASARTLATLVILVAKWPCQKSVSFSRSGSKPNRIR